jgi:glycosyltransferase involved in cell wall biosynthesis
MKIGIVISTYYRPDGKTEEFLTKTLESVKNQKHKDYKVYLIGDKYEKEDEFEKIASSIIDPDKIYYENLSYAKERDVYPNGEKLWCSGGVNARNYGIEKCLTDGIDFICSLDHDDLFTENHLKNFSDFIENNSQDYVFLANRSNYLNKYIVPVNSKPGRFYPTASDLVHSSVCINFRKLPLRFRDVFAETGVVYASDADLWTRTTEFLKTKNLMAYLLDEVTSIYYKKEKM